MSGPFVLDASLTLSWATPYTLHVLQTLKTTHAAAPAFWPFEVARVLAAAERSSGRSGVHTHLVLPGGAGQWSRAEVWTAAEKAEKRKDARTARDWEVALPDELSQQERRELAVRLAGSLARKYGCAVDVALHALEPGGDQRNWHTHLLATPRKVTGALAEKCDIELSDAKRLSLGLAPARIWRYLATGEVLDIGRSGGARQWDSDAKACRETLKTIEWESDQLAMSAAATEEWRRKHPVPALPLRTGLRKRRPIYSTSNRRAPKAPVSSRAASSGSRNSSRLGRKSAWPTSSS